MKHDDDFQETRPVETRSDVGETVGGATGTCVTVIDGPGPGGAHHNYRVSACDDAGKPIEPLGKFARVQFQNGGIKEVGVNGCTQEDLLGIVAHRLACFQSGPFKCYENGLALQHVEGALHWLATRTKERMARGVEGVSVA